MRLLRRSVGPAARDERPGTADGCWVAASVGPYGAALADGSEYRGRYGLSVAELAEWHRPRLEVLAGRAGPAGLETIPDVDEAEALLPRSPGSGCRRGCRTRSPATARGPASRWRRRSPCGPRPRSSAVGRQLLRPVRRRGGDRDRPGGHREAGDRLPEQRRGLGRGAPPADWPAAVAAASAPHGWRRARGPGRLLPGGPGGDRRGGAGTARREAPRTINPADRADGSPARAPAG